MMESRLLMTAGVPSQPVVTPDVSGTSVLRIASYNMEDDINGNTTPLPGFYQVLEGIGEEKVQGNIRPVDIVGLEETTSNSVTVAPVVTNLNSYYNGAAVYAQSTYQATQDGGNTDGNGPNALVYNTSTLKLIASVGVGTPEGATNGEYRQVVRYEFQPVGDTGSAGIFYFYVSHSKSGTTSADATARGQEATIVRNDEATLPANSSVIYSGDLNAAPPEAEFTNYTAAGQGQASDPVNFPTSVQYYSESDTALRYRDDYELLTSNVLNDTGAINYVSGSFHNFANNGTTPSGGSVNSGSDTALNSDLFQDGGTFISASTLYSDLTTASDHLPVVADYTISTTVTNGTPTIGSFVANPASVTAGTSTTLTASNVAETGGAGTITGVNFYRETNGSTGLQIGSDTLVGAGTQSGTTWMISATTSGFAAGTYTYYAVATDSNGASSAVSSTTLTVTSGGGTSISGTVLAWDTDGQTSYGTQGLKATTVATGATNSTGLTRGSGVTTSGTAAGNAWGGTGWASTSSAGISGSEYVSFGFTLSTGYTTSLASINLNYRHSSTGPSNGYWQYQVNGGTWALVGDFSNEFSSTGSSGAAITPISLTGITALQSLAAGSVVNFRVVPYGATGTSGTWYVYDGGNNTNDLVLNAGSSPNVKTAVVTGSGGQGASLADAVDRITDLYFNVPDDQLPTPPTKRAHPQGNPGTA